MRTSAHNEAFAFVGERMNASEKTIELVSSELGKLKYLGVVPSNVISLAIDDSEDSPKTAIGARVDQPSCRGQVGRSRVMALLHANLSFWEEGGNLREREKFLCSRAGSGFAIDRGSLEICSARCFADLPMSSHRERPIQLGHRNVDW